MIAILDRGVVDYGVAWKEQQQHFDALLSSTDDDDGNGNQKTREPRGVLMLCEHPHVYTLGKRGVADNLLVSPDFLESIGASYYHTDRGGDVTYHGDGQLVGYPILDLSSLSCGERSGFGNGRGMGLREYIHLLEQCVIDTIAEWGIEGRRSDNATGVWMRAGHNAEGAVLKPERKICALGVKASRFVTMHGFALNVTTDLKYFNYINPCGFTDRGVTSIAAELASDNVKSVPSMDEVKSVFVRHFTRLFGNSERK